MDRLDRWASIAFKVAAAVFVLGIASRRFFPPHVYKMISFPLSVCLGLILLWIGASWALKKLGYIQNGSITVSRQSLVTTLRVVAAGILFAVFVEFVAHNLYINQQATLDLQVSTAGKDALGEPIRVGWYISGYQHSDGASFSIPVKGSKAKGKLEVRGTRKDGLWQIVDLYLVLDGSRTVVQIPH